MTGRATLSVVLLAYGGPQAAEEVESFLRRIMRPAEPAPEMLARALRRYEIIGGGSPLIANTMLQRDALRAYFAGAGASALSQVLGGAVDVEVFVGMRHTPPWVDEALDRALDWGGGRAVAVILASHQSERATGGYHDDVRRALAERTASADMGDGAPGAPAEVTFVRPWHTSPGYLDAVVARTKEALAESTRQMTGGAGSVEVAEGTMVVFSAHSLPVTAGCGDPEYEQGLLETARGVMAGVGDLPWRLAYQSRSGRPGIEWLGPGVEEVLAEESARGVSSVVVVPLGFVVEHLETLYDLDVALQAEAARLGIRMMRAATVRDHPSFIAALGGAVIRAIEEAGWKPSPREDDHVRR